MADPRPLDLRGAFYQGVIVAGFNFAMNVRPLQLYRPSALAAWSLTTPIFGVLVSTALVGDPLTPTLLLSTVTVAAGIGLTTRRCRASDGRGQPALTPPVPPR